MYVVFYITSKLWLNLKYMYCMHSYSNMRNKKMVINTSQVLPFFKISGFEMMHKAWRSIKEMPYCFSRSSIKFQDYTGLSQ